MSRSPDSPSGAANPRAREETVFRSLGREWVVYDPRTQLLHVLNTTAALVWSLCDGLRSPEQIARELADVLTELPSEDRVLEEVGEAIEGFRREGLLE